MPCLCTACNHLLVYPEIPAIDPPPLIEVWKDPGAQWTVACNWLGPLVDGRATLIRRGFKTDGASIPRFTWRIIGHPFQLPLLAYALPHDADYAAELFPKKECDWRFLTNQQTDGHISWAKRNAIYTAVHAFGGSVWKKHTPSNIAEARRYCRVVGEEEWHALNTSRRITTIALK